MFNKTAIVHLLAETTEKITDERAGTCRFFFLGLGFEIEQKKNDRRTGGGTTLSVVDLLGY